MRTQAFPLLLLVLFLAGFCATLAMSANELPPKVATHFNFAGQPDGWMDRSTHLLAMAAIGIGLPLSIAGVFAAMRWLPSSMINLPQREFWLAPERRASTQAYLDRLGIWLACLMVLFLAGINVLIVQANRQQPAQLDNRQLWLLASGFLCGLVAWIAGMLWHFYRPRQAEQA